MKRLFNITVSDCDEIERLTKFYEDLGYQVERGSNYIEIKKNRKYTIITDKSKTVKNNTYVHSTKRMKEYEDIMNKHLVSNFDKGGINMWGEFCEVYAPSNEKIDFLEAVQHMLKGKLCEDFNGRVYKIENRKFYYRRYGSWISCFNYEIPTATEWKLVN